MGRATQSKNEKKIKEEDSMRLSFIRNSLEIKAKSITPEKPLELEIDNYKYLAIRDLTKFTKKTKSKNRDKQVFELIRYAFNKYPVCSALSDSWNSIRKPPIEKVDFKLWYICVATGDSLYKKHAKEYLSKKEVHTLLTCPHDLSLSEGLYYSVAKSSGASEGVSLRIARSKICIKAFNQFWKNCVRFFAENPPDSISKINDLIDFLQSRIQINHNYTINGNTLVSLTKKMHDWHWELQRIKVMGNGRWNGVEIDDEIIKVKDSNNNEINWKMKQIKSSKDLSQEGTKMRHCVYSYKTECVKGNISIWSLSKEDLFEKYSSKVTVELNKDGYIVQARGLANRSIRNDENNVLRLWATRNNLNFSLY